MKKIKSFLILLLFAALIFTSCGSVPNDPISASGVDFEIIDTTKVDVNNFGGTRNYDVIIKMDNSYYSARLTRSGDVDEIYRKLKITSHD